MRRILTRVLVLAAAGAVLVVGYATYLIWQQGEQDDRQPADAIVVLGAAQYDGRPSPVFRARLEHAVELYKDGFAPYFVVTGGNAPGDRTTEAAVARAYALAHGVPETAILVEDKGRNTLDSLRSVARVMREHDLRSAVFVSDRTHMLRVLRIARDQGMTSFGSPTATSPTDRDVTSRADATVHELGALAFYFVTGSAGLEPPPR
jgi:uncharacterized SAM-binding protein YcdF (DUF218 family)